MEYTKKALEAQEAVDEATKLALQRVKMEAEVLKQVLFQFMVVDKKDFAKQPLCQFTQTQVLCPQ